MTDQRDKAKSVSAGGVEEVRPSGGPGISRRAMIRGASAALPTILTLRSGSVLATTSNNFIGRSGAGEDPLLCLNQDTIPGLEPGGSNLINLGSSPVADVIELPSSLTTVTYRYKPQGSAPTSYNALQACEKINDPGLEVKIGTGNWTKLNVSMRPAAPGLCVSSVAAASFGTRLNRRSITDYL